MECFLAMVAFVLVERDTERVLVARDRLGIKPLALRRRAAGAVRFASTLPALLAAGGIDTRLDLVAAIDLVGNQWMSVLSTFTDEELAAGLEEMRERYPQRELHFLDRIAFVSGVR